MFKRWRNWRRLSQASVSMSEPGIAAVFHALLSVARPIAVVLQDLAACSEAHVVHLTIGPFTPRLPVNPDGS